MYETGPPINSVVTDGEEPLPSLSDFHDYEPNLEFDDTELTNPPATNGMISINNMLQVDKKEKKYMYTNLFLFTIQNIANMKMIRNFLRSNILTYSVLVC